jgi:hypothetical protein
LGSFIIIVNSQLLSAAFSRKNLLTNLWIWCWLLTYGSFLVLQSAVHIFHPSAYIWLPLTSKIAAEHLVQALRIDPSCQNGVELCLTSLLFLVVEISVKLDEFSQGPIQRPNFSPEPSESNRRGIWGGPQKKKKTSWMKVAAKEWVFLPDMAPTRVEVLPPPRHAVV